MARALALYVEADAGEQRGSVRSNGDDRIARGVPG
jgi:hypothetical protein